MTPFVEKQRFRQWWILVALLLPTGIMWWGFIAQIVLDEPWGDNPAPDWLMVLLWVCFGIALPAFMLNLRLVTTVDPSGVSLHFRPIRVKGHFPYESIQSHSAIEYRPIREFGGWGIRWGGKGRRAWSISGKQAVQLFLDDGREVVIGSLRADELDQTIGQGKAASRR
jgi:hypothetical protein